MYAGVLCEKAAVRAVLCCAPQLLSRDTSCIC